MFFLLVQGTQPETAQIPRTPPSVSAKFDITGVRKGYR